MDFLAPLIILRFALCKVLRGSDMKGSIVLQKGNILKLKCKFKNYQNTGVTELPAWLLRQECCLTII